MYKFATIIATMFLIGCPSPAQTPVAIDQDCLLEYSVALVNAAGGEGAACEALRQSAWLDQDAAADELHAKVWESPNEKLAEACSGEARRLRLLDKEIRFRARCAMSCPLTGNEDGRPSNCD